MQVALSEAGLQTEIRHFSSGLHTVASAAASIGVDERQIVKALVFSTVSGGPVLALMSGPDLLDERKLERLLHEPVHRPDAQFVRDVTGFPIGGVPPFGHRYPLRTFIDDALWSHSELWAAAGTPTDAFACSPDGLEAATGGTRAELRR